MTIAWRREIPHFLKWAFFGALVLVGAEEGLRIAVPAHAQGRANPQPGVMQSGQGASINIAPNGTAGNANGPCSAVGGGAPCGKTYYDNRKIDQRKTFNDNRSYNTFQENDPVHVLKPANDVINLDGCESTIPTVRFVVGSNAYVYPQVPGRLYQLPEGPIVGVRYENGNALIANLKIIDDRGDAAVVMDESGYSTLNAHVRPQGESTVIVYDHKGDVIFGIRFANKNTFILFGEFRQSDGNVIHVEPDGTVLDTGSRISYSGHNCFIYR